MNCNGITNKKAALENLVSYTNPDVIILTETKIDGKISPSEFLPDGYQGEVRKDRNRAGGGVMLAFKKCYNVESIELSDVDEETVWASVQAEGGKK